MRNKSTSHIEPLESRIAPANAAILDLSQLNAVGGPSGAVLSGAAAGDNTGYVATAAGDLNADGLPDILISSIFSDTGGTDSGSVYVVFGTPGGIPQNFDLASLQAAGGAPGAGFAIDGFAANDNLGLSASSAGDFNGDGFDDIVIGAYAADLNGTNSGAIYVIYGSTSGFPAHVTQASLTSGLNGAVIVGPSPGALFGRSVVKAQISTVNGAPSDDLIVTADGANSLAGKAYVLFGRQGQLIPQTDVTTFLTTSNSGYEIHGEAASRLGRSASNAGDMDGDGWDDVLLGAEDASPNGAGSGAAYVIYGRDGTNRPIGNVILSTLASADGFKIEGVAAGDRAGSVVAGLGDINGDGTSDVAIGATTRGTNGTQAGAAYVIYGKSQAAGLIQTPLDLGALNPNGSAGFRIYGTGAGDFLGYVAGPGDVNGDGYNDIAIGATGADFVNAQGDVIEDSGMVAIIYGHNSTAIPFPERFELATLNGTNGFIIGGALKNDRAGRVFAAGDVNGDGIRDLLITSIDADLNGRLDSGAAYLVHGTPTEVPVTLVNAKTATWTDVDGEKVTVTITKGTLASQNFTLYADHLGARLATLDLTIGGQTVFKKTDIKILSKKVSRTAVTDGLVNIGYINATGVDLTTVKVGGNLGEIDAGSITQQIGLKALDVFSMGGMDGVTAGDNVSRIRAGLTSVKIKTDFVGTALTVDFAISKATIGGSAYSAGVTGAGFFSDVRIGTFLIKGGIIGDAGNPFTISGRGAPVLDESPAFAIGIKSLTVKQQVEHALIVAGNSISGTPINPNAIIAKVIVKGDWIASSLAAGAQPINPPFYGNPGDTRIPLGFSEPKSAILSVSIGTKTNPRQILGTPTISGDKFGFVAEIIKSFKLNGIELTRVPGLIDGSPVPGAGSNDVLINIL